MTLVKKLFCNKTIPFLTIIKMKIVKNLVINCDMLRILCLKCFNFGNCVFPLKVVLRKDSKLCKKPWFLCKVRQCKIKEIRINITMDKNIDSLYYITITKIHTKNCLYLKICPYNIVIVFMRNGENSKVIEQFKRNMSL